jgi:hypothetical protein
MDQKKQAPHLMRSLFQSLQQRDRQAYLPEPDGPGGFDNEPPDPLLPLEPGAPAGPGAPLGPGAPAGPLGPGEPGEPGTTTVLGPEEAGGVTTTSAGFSVVQPAKSARLKSAAIPESIMAHLGRLVDP